MIRRRKQGDLNALAAMPSEQRHSRTIADQVEVYLPPVRWTPDLVEGVARLLADAVVRDVTESPTPTRKGPP